MNAPAPRYDDEIEEILSYYGGDAKAAMHDMLRDRDFLLREIELASMAISPGYTRGWKPTVFAKSALPR